MAKRNYYEKRGYKPKKTEDKEEHKSQTEYEEEHEKKPRHIKPSLEGILGGFSFLTGVAFVLNSVSSITGFTIAEELSRGASSVLGILFILVGLILLAKKKTSFG